MNINTPELQSKRAEINYYYSTETLKTIICLFALAYYVTNCRRQIHETI